MSFAVDRSVEELALLFESEQENIIIEWRSQLARVLRSLSLDKKTMTDHMPAVVAEIICELKAGKDQSDALLQSPGSPPVHGVQRFYDGLDVAEVVAEYNLLRVAFITIAERNGFYVVGQVAMIINHRLDEAVRMAVTAFAAHQTQIRKAQQEEHLSFIVHDIRTPLNAVSLLVDELALDLDDTILHDKMEVFEIIRRNLQRVEELTQKMLAGSMEATPEGGAFRPRRRHVELWPLVQRLIRDLEPVASKNAVRVSNDIPRSLTIFADASLLTQVLQNLLANAYKYAVNSQVTLSARDDSGTVTCLVKDAGSGIAPEMLDKVFDKWATDQNSNGTGLGLAIVKQIIEAHGGTAHVVSTLGEGATFVFVIPGQESIAQT